MPENRKKVSLLTEGTYPFNDGGVSTWCDKLISNLDHTDFEVFAVTPQPVRSTRFVLPENVASVMQIPLWGVEHPAEWLGNSRLRELVKVRNDTTLERIEKSFTPALRKFLAGFESHSDTDEALAGLAGISRFLSEHDYEATMKSEVLWQEVLLALNAEWARSALRGASATIQDAIVCARWLYAFFMTLVSPLPRGDIVHATAAAFSAIPGILAKFAYGTPFMLTEHGVYLRERYIAVSKAEMTQLQKAFLACLSSLVSRLCYTQADLIVSVCNFNQRWELPHGVTPDRLRVIHNGVDVDTFVPREKPPDRRGRPTVVAAARLFPLKDIETMVRTAEVVKKQIPDVHFILYGSLTADPDYTERVRRLIAELELDKTFVLAGAHPRPAEIYIQGDITILSSISEAFPYTVLESMSCARPVVATAVGGVPEIIGNLGRLVQPQQPQALGEACVELLRNDQLRLTLGRRAREQVIAQFRDRIIYENYDHLYESFI